MPVGPRPGQPIKPTVPIVVKPEGPPHVPGAPLPKPVPMSRGVPYPDALMAQLEKQVYRPMGERLADFGHFHNMFMSETLAVYHDTTRLSNMVVAVRGTNKYDSADWGADYLIAHGELSDANRYKHDYEALKKFQASHPGAYVYYGVGHSLGGSILDELIKAGLIHSAVSFNPAVQAADYKITQNRRVYSYHDPLYYLQGRLAPYTERLPDVAHTWISDVIDFVGWVGGPLSLVRQAKGLADYLWYHKLDRFLPGQNDPSPTDLIHTGGARRAARRAVKIPMPEFIKEHTHLLDILRSPTPHALKKEYRSQKKELMNIAMPDWVRKHMPEGH